MRFVRITYQECESDESPGAHAGLYKPLGLLQDIRLANGYLDIGDDHDTIELDIEAGELMTPTEARIRRRAQ